MKALLDTHFVVWIVTGSARLQAFPWIDRYRPWGVSPISLLEIQFLAEIKRNEGGSADTADHHVDGEVHDQADGADGHE